MPLILRCNNSSGDNNCCDKYSIVITNYSKILECSSVIKSAINDVCCNVTNEYTIDINADTTIVEHIINLIDDKYYKPLDNDTIYNIIVVCHQYEIILPDYTKILTDDFLHVYRWDAKIVYYLYIDGINSNYTNLGTIIDKYDEKQSRKPITRT